MLPRKWTTELAMSLWRTYLLTGRLKLGPFTWAAMARHHPVVVYYAIFGNCLKGARCADADGHNPEARARTGAWLQTKLGVIPKIASNISL